MGSLPKKLLASVVETVAREFGVENFVETGTYRGETTRWAAERFASVHTIEIDPDQLKSTRASLRDLDNINFYRSDSRTALPKIVNGLSGSAVFWLDAHKGGGFFGSGDDCPIIPELKTINRLPHDALVLVDDARGFLSPPPPPFDWQAWPNIKKVLDVGCAKATRVPVVVDDVIACVPHSMWDSFRVELHRVKPKL